MKTTTMKRQLKKSLAILLTVAMLVGFVPQGANAAPAATEKASDNGVNLTKTLITRNDAPYLKLEAWTEGTVTSSTASAPADVVLVLDQSGSMNGSVESLKTSAQAFVEGLAALNTDNSDKYRVAIVGFASNPENTEILTVNGTEYQYTYTPVKGALDSKKTYYVQMGEGYEAIQYYQKDIFGRWEGWYTQGYFGRGEYIDPNRYTIYSRTEKEIESNTPGKQYDKLTEADYKNAFDNCTAETTARDGSLTKAVDALTAKGATRADLGLGIAEKIFAAQTPSNINRQKVVIFLTDGVPTAHSEFSNEVANGAITSAKTMKDSGTKVYSIYFGNPDSNADTFMKAVSSNYPDATNINTLGVQAASTYYAAGSSWSGIGDLLNSIITSINAPALDEKAVVSDTLSKYVRLANTNTGDPNYSKQIEAYTVAKTANGWSSTEQRLGTAKVDITGKTVNVQGFAFDDYCVTTTPKDGGTDYGAKLVIYIPIAIDGATDTFGGYLPTNDAAVITDSKNHTMATAEGCFRDRDMAYTLANDTRTFQVENQDQFTVTLGESDTSAATEATVNMDTVLSKMIATLPNGTNNEGVSMRYELWDTGDDLTDGQGTLLASFDVAKGENASTTLCDWSQWTWEDKSNSTKQLSMNLANNFARKTLMLRVVLTSTKPSEPPTHRAYSTLELDVQNTDTFVVSGHIDQTDALNKVTVPDSGAFTAAGGRLTQYSSGETVDSGKDGTAVTFVPAAHHEITTITKQVGAGEAVNIYTKAGGVSDTALTANNDGSFTYTATNVTANVTVSATTAPITHTLTTSHDGHSGIMQGKTYNESDSTLPVTFGAMPGYAVDSLTVNDTTYTAADLLAKNAGELEALGIVLETKDSYTASGDATKVIVGGDVKVSQLKDNSVAVTAKNAIIYKLTYRYYKENVTGSGLTYDKMNAQGFKDEVYYVAYGNALNQPTKTPETDYTIDGAMYHMSPWYATTRTSGSTVIGFADPVALDALTMPAADTTYSAMVKKYEDTSYNVPVEKKIAGDAFTGSQTFTVTATIPGNHICGTVELTNNETSTLTVKLTEAQKRAFEKGASIVIKEAIPQDEGDWIYDRTVYVMTYDKAKGFVLTQNQKPVDKAVFTNTYGDPTRFTVTYTDGVADAEIFADQVTDNLKKGAATPTFNGTPTRKGYTFTGWSPTVETTVTDNATYTAQWEKNATFTVTYTDGVTDAEIFADQVTKDLEQGAKTPAFKGENPTREGYTFTGWSPQVADKVTATVIYTAQWTKNATFTVTYTDGVADAEIFADQVTKDLEQGAKTPVFNKGENPTREGYTFTGWSPAVAETVTDNATYTAQWEKNATYSVTYTDGVEDAVIFADQVTKDLEQGAKTPVFKGTEPTREGYTFKGWSPAVAETVTDNATYTAQWEKNATFTVTYTDGVEDAEIFVDQVTADLEQGAKTPVFNKGENPTREGYTFTGWNPKIADTVTKTVTYTAMWEKNSTPTPGPGPSVSKVTLHYESNGGTTYADESFDKGTVVTLDKLPLRQGHTFTGWYSDKDCTNKIDSITMNSNHTVYAGWAITDVPPAFRNDHISYVIGYEDGTVKPLSNITRAEVATIFYRLLSDEERSKYETTENSFADVADTAWYNTPVSTMAAMGIISGYPDGNFHANGAITRAEFAAICARFDKETADTTSNFTDISGHWAEIDIAIAANNGWIMGYPDGSFKPGQTITRAEAMALINRVLQRLPETPQDLMDGMIVWPDNADTTQWYYIPVQEATNSHDYERKENGSEYWTALNNG